MKKGILILAMIVLLAGCSKEGTDKTPDDTGSGQPQTGSEDDSTKDAAKEPGYEFKYDEVIIPMHAEAAPIVEALGKSISYLEAASCAFQGVDKTYTYNSFELTTYPTDGKDYVSSVYFLDDSISTDEGIYLGSTKDEVIAAYGEDYTEESGEITYRMGDTKLAFIMEEDVVASITYTAILEGIND